jgi:hypothetical protein
VLHRTQHSGQGHQAVDVDAHEIPAQFDVAVRGCIKIAVPADRICPQKRSRHLRDVLVRKEATDQVRKAGSAVSADPI